MAYTKPDVFVAIEFGEVTPNITEPELETCIIGEHYFVANKVVSEEQYYDGTQISGMAYPGIPKQSVDTDEDLLVDVSNAEFAPKLYIRTDDGVDVDISAATGVVFAAGAITTIPAGLKYNKSTGNWASTGDALTGQVVSSYRALEEKYTGDSTVLLSITSLEDIIAIFGDNGYARANPLGFGMYHAWLRGQTEIKGIAVGNPPNQDASSSYTGALADELASHAYAGNFLESTEVYCLVPLSFTPIIRDFWISHVKSQSLPENKHERILIIGDQMDSKNVFFASAGEVCGILTSATVGSDWAVGDKITIAGADYYVRFVDDTDAYIAGANGLAGSGITFKQNDGADVTDGVYALPTTGIILYSSAVNFQSPGFSKAKVGDSVAFKADGSVTAAIVSGGVGVNTIQTGAVTGGTPDFGKTGRWEMFRYTTLDGLSTGTPDKNAEAARARDLGKLILTARTWVVIPGYFSFPIAGVRTDIEGYYAACQLGGEVAATVPGYPLGVSTFVGLQESLTHPFKSVRYFNETQLDTIAGGGISIAVNNRPASNCNLRHTLTTDMTYIESQEAMMQTARDSIAKTYRETLRTAIRRFRIGDELDTVLPGMLDGIRTTKLRRKEAREIEHKKVFVPEGAPDTVNVELELTHFYPVNKINVNGKTVTPKSTVLVSS